MSARFDKAIALIDEANSADPNMIETGDGSRPAELAYGQRMSECLGLFRPGASEALKLAVRAQHLMRWTSPRSEYPMDRKGYHAWRNAAKRKHASDVSAILQRAGYTEDEIEDVQRLIRKEGLKRNADAQALEDVACLVFLEHYFSAFAKKHDRDKIIGIVRKTWAKMSEDGHAEAMRIKMDEGSQTIIREALSE